MNLIPALFLDRDGVIIEDVDLLTESSQIKLVPCVSDLVSHFKRQGFGIYVVTNQTVISRGMISIDELNEIHLVLNTMLPEIDDFFVCPHHPNATLSEFKQNCLCRKPKPGLLLQAAEKYNIDLKKSLMIGDRISDIVAANLAGCKSVLLENENAMKKLIETDLDISSNDLKPDQVIKSLSELIE